MALPNNQQGSVNGVTQYVRGTYWKTAAQSTANRQWIQCNDETDTFGYYNYPGSPEGFVAADKGSYCSDTTNGAMYIKTTDTVPTGWVLVATGVIPTTDLHVARYIVSAGGTAQGANFTTIASAYAQAVADSAAGTIPQTVFIQPGTYTENLTLSPNVNLSAFNCDADTPAVTISGKLTLTTAGTVSISGIRLQTNSDFFLAVTGSAASVVNILNCYLNCSNNTGITYTSSSSSSKINIRNCQGNIGTTGISLFASSSAGVLNIEHDEITNTGLSGTASTSSAGQLLIFHSHLYFAITTSGTNQVNMGHSNIDAFAINTIGFTVGGSGSNSVTHSDISGGTASAVSVGSNLNVSHLNAGSSNTNPATGAITGAGTITFSDISMTGGSSVFTTNTKTSYDLIVGRFRSPTQPAFSAWQNGNQTNATGAGTEYFLGTTTDLTEIFDQNSNFTHTTGVFESPVNGIYFLSTTIFVSSITAAMTTGQTFFRTSNRIYLGSNLNCAAARTVAGSADTYQFMCTVLADMDVGDTATSSVNITGGAGNTATINGSTNAVTMFCGQLLA